MQTASPLLNRRRFNQLLQMGWVLPSLLGHHSLIANEPSNSIDSPSGLSDANNQFAFDLLKDLASNKDEANLFFSPFSIESALMLAAEGARGETALVMGRTLQFPNEWKQNSAEQPWSMSLARESLKEHYASFPNPDAPETAELRSQVKSMRAKLAELNTQIETLNKNSKFQESSKLSSEAVVLASRIQELAQKADPYELRIANAVWAERSLALNPSFLDAVSQAYGDGGVFSADFQSNADGERTRINAWVEKQTKDKIRDLIPGGAIDSMTRLVLTNAIYFLGTWKSPFSNDATKSLPFQTSSEKTVSVPMMNKLVEDGVRYGAFREDGSLFETPRAIARDKNSSNEEFYPKRGGFQVLELPYNGDDCTMCIVLPRSKDGLAALESRLDAKLFMTCYDALEQRDVQTSIPRFKLEFKVNLNDSLKRLGMKRAFDGADFRGFLDPKSVQEEMAISAVIHQAFVEVNEKGTEAAAATAVMMARSALPISKPLVPIFQADHPFLFAIMNRKTKTILFLGRLGEPS